MARIKIQYEDSFGKKFSVEVDVSNAEEISEVVKIFKRNEWKYTKRAKSRKGSTVFTDYIAESNSIVPYSDPTLDNLIRLEEEARIKALVSSLTDKQRKRLELRIDNLSFREIAEIEKVGEKSIRETLEVIKKVFMKNF